MFLVVKTLVPGNITPDPLLRPYMGVTPETNPVPAVWQRWDALHYQAIAERGYDAFDTAYYITPMYPLLIRWIGWLLGGHTLLAGILVSSLACLVSLTVLYELAKIELKDVQLTRRALTYFVIFPSAFFLFAPYTESLFLLAALLTLWCLRKEKWLMAGLCGAWAAMSRAPAMMMVIPAAWAAWVAWQRTKVLHPWLALFLTGLGVLAWLVYTWLVAGLSFMKPLKMGQKRLHGCFTFPGAGIVTALRNIWNDLFPIVNWYELFFTILFLTCLVLVIKRLPGVYAVYCLAFMFLYVTRTNELYPLLGMSVMYWCCSRSFLSPHNWGRTAGRTAPSFMARWQGLFSCRRNMPSGVGLDKLL